MSESSSTSNRRTPVSAGESQPVDDGPGAVSGPLVVNGAMAPSTVDSIDPLTRQLRQMYGSIAEEPIPEAIAALLERLKG